MFVVQRRPGERVVIGHSIQVEVISVDGDQVELVLHAPAQVPIYCSDLDRPLAEEAATAVVPDRLTESRYFAECP